LRGDAEGVEGRLGRGGGPEEEDGNEEEVPHGLAARGGEADRRWLASGLFLFRPGASQSQRNGNAN
jgi:hypothetical protein